MAIVVQKFGGTSVANVSCINNVAKIIRKEIDQGNQVAVVVSAMAGTTNQLVEWVNQVSDNLGIGTIEADTVLASGEQITSGLLSLALKKLSLNSRCWQGWQIPIITDNKYGKARIKQIKHEAILNDLKKGIIPVISGFQGVEEEGNNITTLGRGGSDTTAVALAASLGAVRCDIYTDVEGVYTCDPKIVSKAKKLKYITYEEMLEMSSLGAKVLHLRAVELAMKHQVRVQVISSFTNQPGTMVVTEDEMRRNIMEDYYVTGIAYSNNEARITLTNIKNETEAGAKIFAPLAENDIIVDMIVKNINTKDNCFDLTFTVNRSDVDVVVNLLNKNAANIKFENLLIDSNVAKISLVGIGMRSHASIAQIMYNSLAKKNIEIHVISTSEVKISILISDEYKELALRSLHTAFNLDG